MSIHKLPNVLIFNSVFLADLMSNDDLFINKYTQALDNSAKPVDTKVYTKLPDVFTTLNNWPQNTNLACWNCDRRFKTRPHISITSIAASSGSYKYARDGVFCSPNCVEAYHLMHFKGQELDDRKKFYRIWFRECFGKDLFVILPSPPKTIMKKYCGDTGLSDEEYGAKIKDLLNLET